MAAKFITCKLGNMRKVKEWIIYPLDGNNSVTIQCDRRIARIFLDGQHKGRGVLSTKGPYFMDLSNLRGAISVTVPDEIMQQLRDLCPEPQKPDGPVLLSSLV